MSIFALPTPTTTLVTGRRPVGPVAALTAVKAFVVALTLAALVFPGMAEFQGDAMIRWPAWAWQAAC